MSITFRTKIRGTNVTVDAPYKPFTFPDGQSFIKTEGEQYSPDKIEYEIADVRGLDPQDIFHLSMWADTVIENMKESAKLVVLMPYLPGARSDRGIPNFSPYVQAIYNLVTPDRLITVDPHSPAWPENYNRINGGLRVFPVERIIKREVQDGSSDSRDQPYVGVIAPDKGAVERATAAARVMGVPVYKAEKKRDEATGKLSGFHMIDELPEAGKLLIVDDICDGGGTFLGLADATGLPPERLDLWVTHGIFSKGLRELSEHIGHIHTTDSYTSTERIIQQNIYDHDVYEYGHDYVTIHPLIAYLTEAIDV